jgi:serine protease Do
MSDIPTFPPPRRAGGSLAFVATALASVAGGAAGALLLLWFFPALRQVRIPPGTPNIVVERPGKVVVEEGSAVGERRLALLPQVAYLFRSAGAGAPSAYRVQEAVAAAVLLTADGWFATASSATPATGDVLVLEGQALPIVAVVPDTSSPLVLVRAAAADLPAVATFADPAQRFPGMTVFALAPNGDTLKTSLLAAQAPLAADGVASSDRLSFAATLASAAPLLPGTPVYTLSGELLGVAHRQDDQAVVLPAAALASLLTNVLRTGTPNRVSLGVSYVVTAIVPPDAAVGVTNAFVVAGGRDGALPRTAPAAKALRSGDVLLAVDDVPLVHADDLYQLVQRAAPESDLRLSFRRGATALAATVTLKALPDAGPARRSP